MGPRAGTRALGVVGHVDHGKTALVRALTGIETDRLVEERERGLSIVLGFAHFEADGVTTDLIDVPGHEAFIRAMVAGATGLDGILLVVAANEGVQPQTHEHFAIARLLDLHAGLVVLTKCDLADAAQLAAVRRDVDALVADSFLAGALVVAVSAVSGEGIADLVAAIGRLPVRAHDAGHGAPFCLPLDRVFTMQGFGVVGTGTVRSGRIAVSHDVEILPGRLRSSVRGLQRHGRAVEAARAGERIAVNLRGVDRDRVVRGDVVATPGALSPTQCFDAELAVVADAHSAIRNGMSLRLLLGTTDVPVKIRLLDAQELGQGASGFAQLRCERDVVCQRGERFILRSDSPSRTLGGGRIIEPRAPRRRRFDAAVIEALRQAGSTSALQRVARTLAAAGTAGALVSSICEQAGVDAIGLAQLTSQLDAVALGDERLMARAAADEVLAAVVAALRAHHAAQPMRRGMSASELASAVDSSIATDVLKWAVATLREREQIAGATDRLHLASFDPLARLSEAERKAVATLADHFRRSGVEPPSLGDLAKRGKPLQAIVNLLLETGELVKLQTTDRAQVLVLHADVLQDVRERLAQRYPYPAEFAVKDARDVLRSTRRHVVPVLEHLDAIGFTLRRGDMRQLRGKRQGGE